MSGNPMGEEWSTDEHFNMIWKFTYKGDKDIIIDNKQAHVVLQHPGVLIAIEGASNGWASEVYSYAIHLGMKKIVVSQVNAFGTLDITRSQGIKARSTNLRCTFAFHTTQAPSVASNWQDIVRQAQKRLKTLQFDLGPVDGMLGPKTKEALRRFQLAYGLPISGDLDEATRKVLGVE